MRKAKDQAALDCYREVLLKLGQVTDYIQWKELPLCWLFENLPNINVKLVHELMAEHVQSGGEIYQVEETRPEYVWWRFHYDIRMPLSGRRVYIETVLEQGEDAEASTIWIVNLKDQ
jgi:hypothetical protein